MRLRLGEIKDLNNIFEIKTKALSHYKEFGINWTENYPSKETFQNDILNRELYVLEGDEEEIRGIAVINKDEDKAYDSLHWQEKDEYLVIHRVLVNPKFSGRGFGKKLLRIIAQIAKEDEIRALRLDTNSTNILGQKLYKSQAFQTVGEISLEGKSGSFYCLEKIL